VVYLVDLAGSGQAVIETAKIQEFKFVGGAGFILRVLDVNASYPLAFVHQILHQVVSYKAACSSH
jgi:hypothetical protein